jgi:hypothetical protein
MKSRLSLAMASQRRRRAGGGPVAGKSSHPDPKPRTLTPKQPYFTPNRISPKYAVTEAPVLSESDMMPTEATRGGSSPKARR